ncbi:MAG TPA: hypothetical protein VFA12_17460 [Stellaceae bacterium]|nr:hypothetical protein [Stellaceae bacterium]
MRVGSAAILLCVGLAGPAAAAAADNGLTLKRVMLSSGGVGYFEYEATVSGDASLKLGVKLDQVDDVLKSLVVYDQGGTAGEVSLPGREPLAQSFSDLPFDQSALESTAALLNALQGAEVKVRGDKSMTGRVLRVVPETAQGPNGLAISRNRVTLLSDSGLQQFILEDAESVSFTDPDLQAKVATALARIAAHRGDERRQLTLTVHGKGERVVRVGYVVAMPLWKATYRLSLPADPQAAKARVQGWAVLENFSGQPWRGVELTLLSGNPVTFRQALFESYYVPRPQVPVEVIGRVLPEPDTGGVTHRKFAQSETAPAPPPPPAPVAPRLAAPMPAPAPPAGAAEPAPIEAAEASETTTQVVFTLPYKVDAPNGQSIVLPIVDRELPARRVDVYQPRTDHRNPLAAVELTNDGQTGLPPGVLTLYEQTDRGAAYLGDARLATLPAGDKRLLSYAVDNKLIVDRNAAQRRYVVKATIAKGVMHVTRLVRQTTTYEVKGPPGSKTPLLIEHPRLPGWTLSAPNPDGLQQTAEAYRIPVALDAKGEARMDVTEDRPVEETVALADIADDALAAFASAGELDPKVRTALAEVASRRQKVATLRTNLDRLKQQRDGLIADEKRLRDIIAPLPSDSALRKRTIEKLSKTEDTVEELSATMTKAAADLHAAEDDLRTYVAGLDL